MSGATEVQRSRAPASRARQGEAALEAFLARRMADMLRVRGRTKRSAARLAILAAIRDGLLAPGQSLPSEKRLAAVLGVALGTVQAALRQLQLTDTIVRRRGDGSRVASVEPLSATVWHFRFLSKADGLPLRSVRQRVRIEASEEAGPWSDYLKGAARYVRISRRMTMSDRSPIYGEMYLDADATPGLERLDPSELDTVNIRPWLEEMFGLHAAGTRHTVRTAALRARRLRDLGFAPAALVFEIHAYTFSQQQEPVYFQRIYADSETCVLDF